MERRTQPGYEYHSCDFMDEGVYIDMNLLRDYEDTGLTPPEIMELAERDTAGWRTRSRTDMQRGSSYIKHTRITV